MDNHFLTSVFIDEAIGRTVGDIREKDLRPLRNGIGHLLNEEIKDGPPKVRMWIDDPVQLLAVGHWLPITTCISRLLLKNEFANFLPLLDETGNPRTNQR